VLNADDPGMGKSASFLAAVCFLALAALSSLLLRLWLMTPGAAKMVKSAAAFPMLTWSG